MFNRISQHLGVPTDAPTSEQAREAAAELSARAREGYGQAREGLEQALSSVRSQIVRHPARSLAAALALGAMVGWFIKRR
ncbi:hypothetical protein [Tautonia plasticadhaerens]|uniref:DUF883 domain-containing protein n=1 Tax=Tautonia plasticadhaerens TaxID=2527974 RepID=A0A518HDS7_9BACT|nr:hypothetical protein [Tautonia plasticadhaerens]QDV39005.1 hypothetical protein ElP_69660 [Tautonia plasticadhaerens]